MVQIGFTNPFKPLTFMALQLSKAFVLTAVLASSLSTGAWAHGDGAEETSYGRPGAPDHVTRTIHLDMTDNMRFSESNVKVKKGETIRFVLKNAGQIPHEFSLGTQAELDEHYEVMKKFPNMKHDEPNKVSVAPGQSGEVIWQFTKAGTVKFACLHPGHYDAGMKGQVKVSAQ